MLKASQELRCKNLSVITWDYEGEIGKIKCKPLWKWLLETHGVSKALEVKLIMKQVDCDEFMKQQYKLLQEKDKFVSLDEKINT